MVKRSFLIVGVMLLVVVIVFGYKLFTYLQQQSALASYQRPPVSVSAIVAKQTEWQSYLNSIGSLEALQGVDIAPQVDGIVTKIYFESGHMIQAGQPMIALDTQVLAAQLANAVATMNLARVTYERNQTLYQKKFVSHESIDTTRSQYNQALANVNAIKAQIQQKTVYAPFTGRLGLRAVNLGQYLTAGTVVTNLQELDPILVNFAIQSQDIQKISVGQSVLVYSDTMPGQTFEGKVVALDAKVNTDTRSITVRAEIPNPKATLYPGLFVTVKIVLPNTQKVIVVPQTAVAYTLYGDSVYVIEKKTDNTGKSKFIASAKMVTVGERREEEVAILKGLQANDLVVTAGQLKLQNNTWVKVDPSAGSSE